MEDLWAQKQKELEFYDFHVGETVASIGAQCCHWEAAFAATTDSVLFYLEDIDTTYFKKSQAGFAWHYYDSLRGRAMTSQYKMVVGDEKSTSLPDNRFDKIFIINSFHEFTSRAEMLADLKKKLKPGGILYIDESLPKRPGQLHGICKKPMLTHEEMIALLSANGFEYADGLDLNFRKKRPMRKIYAFEKKN
jgi:SAM-dependent methyltransferase